MNKCRSFLPKFSLKCVRINSTVWVLAVLGIEIFLLVTSCMVLSSFPSNSLFTPLCVISLLSSLTVLGNLALNLLVSRKLKKPLIYLSIFLLVSYLSLAGGHIYYSVLINIIKNYLEQQVQLCENSEIFAGIYRE